jgi:hypothetical protein
MILVSKLKGPCWPFKLKKKHFKRFQTKAWRCLQGWLGQALIALQKEGAYPFHIVSVGLKSIKLQVKQDSHWSDGMTFVPIHQQLIGRARYKKKKNSVGIVVPMGFLPLEALAGQKVSGDKAPCVNQSFSL